MAKESNFTIRPAGFWIRAAARGIDYSLLFVALMPIMAFYGFLLGSKIIRQNPLFDVAWLLSLLGLTIAYFIVMVWKQGGTLGKLALGLQIVSEKQEHPSLGMAVARYFTQVLSGLLLFAGNIMAGIRSDKRSLHDLICSTQVKRVTAIPVVGIVALCLLPIFFIGFMFILFAITLPAITSNLEKAREASTQGSYSAIFNAIAAYEIDNGQWPKKIDQPPFIGQYLGAMPAIRIKGKRNTHVEYYSFSKKGKIDPGKLKFTGGWAYDPSSGTLVLDLEGKDSRGTEYWMYGFK